MKIAVLGAGAIGGVIGGYLARAGRDVTMIDMWPANIERIKKDGLTVSPQEDEFTVRPAALHLADVSAARRQYDVIFLSVKSYDTEWSAKFIEPYMAQGAYIASAQNSINDDRIAEIVGWSRVIGCVVTLGAGMYEPGHVIRSSPADSVSFKVGEPNGLVTPRLETLQELLDAVGPTHTTTNLWGERWSKLATNSMFNALAGITGLKSAEMRGNPRTRDVSVRIAAEVVDVATALGVSVEPISGIEPELFSRALTDGQAREELAGRMVEGGERLREGRPSLGQDVMKGRVTEVQHLNGLVARRGREAGVPTPTNEAIVGLTLRIETGELEQSLSNLDQISV